MEADDDLQWGARAADAGSFCFGIWAPDASTVDAVVDGRVTPLARDGGGFWAGTAPARAGEAYVFRIDGADRADPASRLQAAGVEGPSVLASGGYKWRTDWRGRPFTDAAFLEIHVGTFTPEGTFAAAAAKLPEIARLGITAIELMPVAQFPGSRGWGYDGVLLFAVHPAYGTPDELRALVDAAHGLGLMVFLDVVMNHFGPLGNHLPNYAPRFFDADRQTPWGGAVAFHEPAVTAFFTQNAVYWLREFRFDGLRLDAIDYVDPDGTFLPDLARRLHEADFGRPVYLTTEDDRNITRLHAPGLCDGEWNDDWHHAVHAALTGERGSYLAPFAVDPVGDIALALEHGFVERGQRRSGTDARRGEPSDHLPPERFVTFNQNHDQIGNRARGDRLLTLTSPDAARVAHALLLLAPFTPLLFMGEEAGETVPFQFFTDYAGELGEAVQTGRADGIQDFAGEGSPAVPDPNAFETFARSRLSWTDGAAAQHWRSLTARLLALRARYVVPRVASGRRAPTQVIRDGRHVTARWQFGMGDLGITLALDAADIPRPPGFFAWVSPRWSIRAWATG